MSNQKHTPEPWNHADPIQFPELDNGSRILKKEDFLRACQCVNACAEAPNDHLELVALGIAKGNHGSVFALVHELRQKEGYFRNLLAQYHLWTKNVKAAEGMGFDQFFLAKSELRKIVQEVELALKGEENGK